MPEGISTMSEVENVDPARSMDIVRLKGEGRRGDHELTTVYCSLGILQGLKKGH